MVDCADIPTTFARINHRSSINSIRVIANPTLRKPFLIYKRPNTSHISKMYSNTLVYEKLVRRFSSFNWADSATTVHLASQTQNLCIRQEAGYCCVQYQVLVIPLPSFEKSSSSYSKYIMQKYLFCKS